MHTAKRDIADHSPSPSSLPRSVPWLHCRSAPSLSPRVETHLPLSRCCSDSHLSNRPLARCPLSFVFCFTPTAVLEGTVNDAAPTFTAEKSHGSYHWTFERVLSAGLIPIMGGAAVSSGSAYVSYSSLMHNSPADRFFLMPPNPQPHNSILRNYDPLLALDRPIVISLN